MADTPQSYAHHTRWDPLFHFILMPVFGFTVVTAIVMLCKHPHLHSAFMLLLSLALLLAVLKIRLYALKVQDRVIRLEERLRLAMLLQDPLRARIPELTVDQLVGLRFASDAEIPALVERTLRENLKRNDIKKSIQNWRPDNWRV